MNNSLLHYQTLGFCKESFTFQFFLADFLKNQDLQYNENRIQNFAVDSDSIRDF
ncbi:hypothetical protein LEP1GSC036_4661 [Leptospira weilii str. 2006001853]|uniref:Uncharacterized protein n=4 Tax=Leptospira weilii TaxID=28184 RepID=A0A828Z5Q9_9LEPT|nr:hypothetical protein LEP1GSC036_4661 [Leptospira weilii str. 2006001853]EMM71953.1 hypothetical protein LEP1GSC038_4217 [Leptospira weilii str. 2006001855]EMN45635.1 hypothetical protein LEP1GSC086_2661 [Leptospira weilii str. LNT 1234]EMN88740.1 hypothetical protein LEP1GSC108_1349 [Leptospira weilii str. UI 13098]EMY16078.1 hypothetical protein LEP1GSC043_0838 [Leptospira weilii str. Ecochallenge]